MALFKILNNFESKGQLPAEYHKGFCYFDVNTGKFYIDTTDTAEGRMPLNSANADKLKTAIEIKLSKDVIGTATFDGSQNINIAATVKNYTHNHDNQYLKLTGGTVTGSIVTTASASTSWINGAKNPTFKVNNTGYCGWIGGNAKDGVITIGSYKSNNNDLYFTYFTQATLDAGTNAPNKQMVWHADTNTLEATNFKGNASTASKLAKAVKISLTNDAGGNVLFDGSTDVFLKVDVNDDSHNHTHLNFTSILTNQDLNDYHNDRFEVYKAGGGNTVANKPDGNAFGLLCYPNAMGYRAQELLTSTGIKYIRYYNTSTWSDWKQVAFTTDNVASADKWKTPRTLTLTGNVTGHVTFDGDDDFSLVTTVAPDSHLHDTTYVRRDGRTPMSDSLTIQGANKDLFINFLHSGTETGYDWRVGQLGTGSGDANYFVIQSNSTGTTWTTVMRAGLTSHDVTFTGDVTAASFIGNATSADKWKNPIKITLTNGATGNVTFDGSGNQNLAVTVVGNQHTHSNDQITNLDGEKITSGIIPLERIPQGALERMVVVADDTARFKLTTTNVQLGDVVKVTSTNKMYFVKDQTKLTTEAGYEVFAAGTAASVSWANITSVPELSFSTDVTGSIALAGIPENGKKNVSITVVQAGKLKNEFKINGTGFNGTKNITTSTWGTARNVTIKDYNNTHEGIITAMGASTAAYILHLPDTITATIIGNASSANKIAAAKKITITQKNNTIGSFSFDGSKHVTANLDLVPSFFEYHDLLVFGIDSGGFPKFYTATSNDNYVENALNKNPFDGKDKTNVILDFNTYTSVMWQWDSFPTHTSAEWLSLSGGYSSPFSNIDIIVEISSDGTNWTTVGQANNININSQSRWIRVSSFGYNNTHVRIKFTKKADGTLPLERICLYTRRPGNQGSGNEIKYPYIWDADRNVSFPAKVTATTFYGNATSASKWKTPVKITLTGDVTGNITFDGSTDFSLPTSVQNYTHNHDGRYLKLTGGTLSGALTISHAASAVMDKNTTNPRIIFSENGNQAVALVYSDYDSYRVPYGLKVVGLDGGNAWFEAPDIYATTFHGNATSASKWAAGIKISATGDATGNVTFDGSSNQSLKLDVLTAAKTDYALTVNVKNVAGATTTTTFDGSSAKTINIDAANFMPVFTFSKTLTLTTSWQDLGITGNNIPNTGSYIIQILIDDNSTPGTLSNYSEYYTGVMSWYAAGTNSTDYDEIILHKAGHASNNKYIYLQTVRSSGGKLKMQIAANVTATAASTLTIKVRQLI